MNALSVACRRSVLVIAMSVIGMPVPASAAGEGRGGVSRQRHLTLDGRPLSRLLNLTFTTGGGVDGYLARTGTTSASSGVLKLRISDAGPVTATHATHTESAGEFAEAVVG